jgi:glycosyltransferase involved in cell wall biosynthesis
LIRRVKELGLASVISFNDFTDETEKIIKESDIILNFSEAESFSMTCAEASFYGRPVIATKCGGPEEIIMHNFSGLLVENRNVREMKEAILKLSRNKELREEMGRAGKKFVREKFTEETFKKEFSKLLQET